MVLKTKSSRREREDINAVIKEVGLEEKSRLNSLIPSSLHQRLKIHAAKAGKGVTVTSIVIGLLEEYMSNKS
jgi:hypothetical protein